MRPPSPRRDLHPEFVSAFITSDERSCALAHLIGLERTRLGRLMNARTVVATPRVVQQLSTLATLLGYPTDRMFR